MVERERWFKRLVAEARAEERARRLAFIRGILRAEWLHLRSPHANIERVRGMILMAASLGEIESSEARDWWAQIEECPGHAGLVVCAYCGPVSQPNAEIVDGHRSARWLRVLSRWEAKHTLSREYSTTSSVSEPPLRPRSGGRP